MWCGYQVTEPAPQNAWDVKTMSCDRLAAEHCVYLHIRKKGDVGKTGLCQHLDAIVQRSPVVGLPVSRPALPYGLSQAHIHGMGGSAQLERVEGG